jgi:endopeptidase La
MSISISKRKINKINNFQFIIKYKLSIIRKINQELNLIYNFICSTMSNLNQHININKLKKKEKYNMYVEKIEKIFSDYNKIIYPVSIHYLNDIGKNNLYLIINEIFEQLFKVCEEIGAISCSNVISIFKNDDKDWKLNLSKKYIRLLNFYDKFFIITNTKFIKNKKKIEEILSMIKLENNHLPFGKKLDKIGLTLSEKINGATIYFPFKFQLIKINGYFKEDPLNITRINGTFGKKLESLINDTNYLDIPTNFKERYIGQLSLRDFIILNNRDIILLIKRSYDELKKLKNKTLSSLINEFVKGSIEKQRKILTLFLLSNDEDQFKAHIIFDLISNQSLIFQAKPHAEQIYNTLHWSLKKNFKVIIKNIEEKKRKLESLSYNDVPYESRIVSMKAPDKVVKKAMEKLKEVKISKENGGKARQYLDGLLQIPFGYYHKEEIFSFFEEYKEKLENVISLINCKLDEIKDKKFKEYLEDIINNYYIKINTNNDSAINNFIKYLDECLLDFNKYLHLDSNQVEKLNINKEILNKYKIKIFVKKSKKEENKEEIKVIGDISLYKESLNKLKFYNNIKDTLIEKGLLTDNHVNLITDKLEEVEDIIKMDKENSDDEESEEYEFIRYCFLEFSNLVFQWEKFRDDKKNYMKNVEGTLDKSVYGHVETKKQIKRIVGQWINGEMKGQIFGLVGPPGVGKTTICKNGLSKCLVNKNGECRPFAFLALGGKSNGSYLDGHNYTYLGSRWGKIVEILMETKCMNPIIYVDELDKVSQTEHGREIVGILTHLTDPVQNKEFSDKYFQGIEFDLSKALFVFSYNDRSKVDRILRDRIQEIRINSLVKREKLVISNRYILPDIYKSVGFSKQEISFDNDILSDLIDNYTYEAGVRKLNEILFDIVRELNVKKILNEDVKFPLKVSKEFIKDFMSHKPRVQRKKIAKKAQIGVVNGLYATETGLGGITLIEVMNTPTEKKKISIEKLTGSQGDVMKESMHCALTLASNLIPKNILNNISEAGLHIHCPEASTPKDGPSAGITITTCIISRICGIPVRNTIAMTGEVDIHGNVHKIGGLEAKLNGAMMAGVKRVLIPIDNKEDYEKILDKEAEFELSKTYEEDKTLQEKKKTISKDLDVKIVKNINEVLKYALIKNNVKFNKI